jgi:hypothetical protein
MENNGRDTVLENAAAFGGILAEQYGVSSLDELMDILQLGVDSPHLHALRAQVVSAERGKSPESSVIVDGTLHPPLVTWNEWSPDRSPSPTVYARESADEPINDLLHAPLDTTATEEHGPSAWRRTAAVARKIAAVPLSAARTTIDALAPHSPTTFSTQGRQAAFFYSVWRSPLTGDRLLYHIPMANHGPSEYNRPSQSIGLQKHPK